MSPGPRIDWPAQAPPDDFADKVVGAALGERPPVTVAEPMPIQPRQGVWRRRLGWLVAAAFGATFLATILVVNKVQEAKRESAAAAAVIAAKEEEAKLLQQQIQEAQQKVDVLMDQLATATNDAQRAELKQKIEEEKAKQAGLRARSGGGDPGRQARPACKCAPGDPLCSCL